MTWGTDFQWGEVVQRLVDTRLRTERIRLAQRLQAVEARAARAGLSTKELRDLRKALQPIVVLAPGRVDPVLVLPRKPEGIWRRRYLKVTTKPGSIF